MKNWLEIEDNIIAHQTTLIREKYGEEQSHNCNYGWGVDEQEDQTVVETKIYGQNMVLTTSSSDGIDFEDEWSTYR